MGMEAYPVELRNRVVAAYEAGEGSYKTLGERFRLGEATVKRWVTRQRADGDVRPRKKGGGTASTIDLGELETIVDELGDANAFEIAAAYNKGRRGRKRRHVSSIKRALHRAGYVVKKNEFGRWSSSGRTSSQSERPSAVECAVFPSSGLSSSTKRA
jgi:transposase